MRNSLILGVLLFAMLPAFSIDFDEMCEKLTAHSVTTGDFVQEKRAKALKRPLKSQGKFRIDENGIEWKTEKPFKSTMKVNKTEIIQIAADGKVTKMDGRGNQVFMSVAETISTIFTGDKEALNRNFITNFEDKGAEWKLSLEPKDSTIKSAISIIEMNGKVDKDEFDSVKVTQASGDTILYSFTNQSH